MTFASAALIAMVWLLAGPAEAQTRYVPGPQPMPSPGVPGQNLSPPAPRQNLAPPPNRTPRPGEGDSTTRIQTDRSSRMPAPPPPVPGQ
ncbi:hypothetical protein [Aquabacter spiritensis]|uniref:Uncharacterized protein n=1 Tax=Aquabacter spiritensis TaxID=933073 RepID=A0A4R3LTN5_9HYPH|nr:hypothetical protein [Aquabacter spiritensis]TCT03930.1 hypothetical protein EDC64_10896 [Aquabacter spiritensis]